MDPTTSGSNSLTPQQQMLLMSLMQQQGSAGQTVPGGAGGAGVYVPNGAGVNASNTLQKALMGLAMKQMMTKIPSIQSGSAGPSQSTLNADDASTAAQLQPIQSLSPAQMGMGAMADDVDDEDEAAGV